MNASSLFSESGLGSEEVSPQPPGGSKRLMLAAGLSALLPGAGQLLLGQRRKGTLFLLVLVALLIGFWPLRLLRFYWGFCTLYISWIALFVYPACSALAASLPGTLARASRWWLLAVLPLAFLAMQLLGAAVTRASGFKSFTVPSTSMERTIQKDDHIVADIWFYNSRSPNRKDVIIYKSKGLFIVKRVIAVGGDTIAGRGGAVLLNGQPLNEPFVEHRGASALPWLDTFGPITVSSNKYFVMGDNRDVSLDSRSPEIGLIDKNSIVGKTLYVFSSGRQGEKVQ